MGPFCPTRSPRQGYIAGAGAAILVGWMRIGRREACRCHLPQFSSSSFWPPSQPSQVSHAMIAVAAWCAPIAKYFPAMVGETEFDAIAVRICNPPPAGPGKTRNQSPLGRFQHVP